MRDTAGLIKTQKQFDRLLSLCAREIGTINKFIDIELIADIGDGKYKVKVMYKHYYLYAMIYDGKKNYGMCEVITVMKIIKWVLRITGFIIGVGILGLFVWLGVNIGQWAGLL